MENNHRYQAARRVTIIGAVVNFILAVGKIIIGIIGLSHALFADGVHSLADLVTDALVVIAAKIGSKGADLDHQYGHQRIETAATTLLSLFLIAAGIGIMIDAGMHLLHKTTEAPKLYVLWVAIFSTAVKELLYRYTMHVAKKTKSLLLEANAWHHRSDAATSIVVLIGISAALLGYHYFDAIAAIIVGILIIKMGVSFAWSSLSELVDTAANPNLLDQINDMIKSIPGVEMVHQLRTRSMAGNVLVDVHIMVNSNISVSEGHYIASQVHHQLKEKIPEITDVTVHVDAENDEIVPPNLHLPSRQEVIDELKSSWQGLPGYNEHTKIILHYLSGKIQVEVYLPTNLWHDTESLVALQEKYHQAVKHLDYVDSITLWLGKD